MNILDKFYQAGLITMPEDCTNYIWNFDGNTVSWNSENNEEHLFNGEGETYSEMNLDEPQELDGYMIVTLSDSCGGSGQCIFDLSKRVNYNE